MFDCMCALTAGMRYHSCIGGVLRAAAVLRLKGTMSVNTRLSLTFSSLCTHLSDIFDTVHGIAYGAVVMTPYIHQRCNLQWVPLQLPIVSRTRPAMYL